MQLNSTDPITTNIREQGIYHFDHLLDHLKQFNYNRISNSDDLSLVWKEKRGTCSSKHAFASWIAELNEIKHVQLHVVIFKMNGVNTPQINKVLEVYSLDYIPEAHCFISVKGKHIDVTFKDSDLSSIEDDILDGKQLNHNELSNTKPQYHKQYLVKWIEGNKLGYTLNELWAIRELCIQALSED